MAENKNYYSNLWYLGVFLILSTVFVALSMILIVATNDYILYNFYEISEDLVDSGLMTNSILTFIEEMAETIVGMLQYVDMFWAVAFVLFVISYMISSYNAKREGYLSVFGFISFGVMAVLFLLNFLLTYNNSLYELFFNRILISVVEELTLFNFYISNFQVVNLILIIGGLLINFIPFDTIIYNNRKEADELQEIN